MNIDDLKVNSNGNDNRSREKGDPDYNKDDILVEDRKPADTFKCFSTSSSVKEIIQLDSSYQDTFLVCPGLTAGVPVHRFVLAAASSFLAECLQSDEENSQVLLADCTPRLLTSLVQYIYRGSVSVSCKEDKLALQELVSRLKVGEQGLVKEQDRLGESQVEIKTEQSYCHIEQRTETDRDFINDDSDEEEDEEDKEEEVLPSKRRQMTKPRKKNSASWENEFIFNYKAETEKSEVKPEIDETQRSKAPQGEFKCDHCGKTFTRRQKYQDHMTKHSGEKLKCKFCPKMFERPGLRRVHEQLHTKPFKCTECDAAFGRKSNLIGHQRIHRGERPYICDLCGSAFPIQSSLLTHKKQSHPQGNKPWFCEYCENRFVSKSQLEIHRRVHTGEKPWICDNCGRAFSTKQNMLDHTRLHNDKMDYCCNQCGQQFKWKQSLERHMMDHSGVRPNPCDQCKLTFKTSNSLKKHKLSVHSEIKHFACQFCSSRFSTSSGVLRHQKKQRCSALKQGVVEGDIKVEKQHTRVLLAEDQGPRPGEKEEELQQRQRQELLQYLGTTAGKEAAVLQAVRNRPAELLQYLSKEQDKQFGVKQEELGRTSYKSSSQYGLVGIPSIMSVAGGTLVDVAGGAQPLSLALPRPGQEEEEQRVEEHPNYRLHMQ